MSAGRYGYAATQTVEGASGEAQAEYAPTVGWPAELGAAREQPRRGLLELLPPLQLGFLLCVGVAAEGLLALLGSVGALAGAAGTLAGLSKDNPFHRVQWALMEALGVGDLVASALGAAGVYAAERPLPYYVGGLRSWHAAVATAAVGVLLAWRAMVALAVVPWMGFMLVFEPPEYVRWPRLAGALAFMALSLYVVRALVVVFHTVRRESLEVQEEVLLEQLEERHELLRKARAAVEAGQVEREDHLRGATLFGCLPLELTVACYTLVVSLGCLLFTANLLAAGSTSGGWAFFNAPRGRQGATFWLELLAYSISVIFGLLAVSAIIAHKYLEGAEDVAAVQTHRRCSALVLAFFVFSLLRFGLFVPITGMALVAEDICGLYVHALASLSMERRLYPSGAPVGCTTVEWVTLGGMLVVMVLDAYLIHGVFQLWQRYRAACTASFGQVPAGFLFGGQAGGGPSYGAAGAAQ